MLGVGVGIVRFVLPGGDGSAPSGAVAFEAPGGSGAMLGPCGA